MKKKTVLIAIGSIIGIIAIFALGVFVAENDILDDLSFSSNKTKVTVKTEQKVNKKAKSHKISFFGPKVNISKNKAKTIQYQNYNNGLVSMQIPKGWVVGVGKSDFIHYTFMAYDPQNPDYKIFFANKKANEGFLG